MKRIYKIFFISIILIIFIILINLFKQNILKNKNQLKHKFNANNRNKNIISSNLTLIDLNNETELHKKMDIIDKQYNEIKNPNLLDNYTIGINYLMNKKNIKKSLVYFKNCILEIDNYINENLSKIKKIDKKFKYNFSYDIIYT